MTLVNNTVRIYSNRIINKHIHMLLGGQQRTDVAFVSKVGTISKFNFFYNIRISLVYELACLAAYILLPARQRIYIGINFLAVVHDYIITNT